MNYQAELKYLSRVLEKMHLQLSRPGERDFSLRRLDFGLRESLGPEEAAPYRERASAPEANTIYKLTDEFLCNYLYLLLPDTPEGRPLVIGPYLSFELTREQLMEEAERLGLPAWRISRLEASYAVIPVLRDETALFSMLDVFASLIWGEGRNYRMLDLNREQREALYAGDRAEAEKEEGPEELLQRMQQMERRYAYENELMENVRNGHAQRAERMLSGFSRLVFEQRTADPLRNLKNYAIISNTLLRKAAEQGGVHPLYLDRTSSDFARQIQALQSLEAGRLLMLEMLHSYCRLVRRNALGSYSPLIRKTVTYIDADLSGELSLSALAAAQNISPSYLSALFHRETGKTVTDYVTEKRMEAAARLLRSTRLQVQTVAQHCGMADANYFSKIFKKYHGLTPRQYRETYAAPAK